MRVIKKGREQTGWSQEIKCSGKGNGNGGCGALLLVETPDMFRTFQCHAGETDTYVTFECSECHVHTDLPEFMQPPKIAELPSLRDWLVARKKSTT